MKITTEKNTEKRMTIEILSVGKLQHFALLQYAVWLDIFPNIVSQYCVEIYHQIRCTGKKYFSIGFKNNSGVYELSNYYGKTCTRTKDIRWIKNAVHSLLVFEGFFDFLSFVQIKENYVNISRKSFDVLSSEWQANHDFLVLNYLSLYTKLTSFFSKYKTVGLLPDNIPQ